MYKLSRFDSKRNSGCMRKVQKDEGKGVGMSKTLACEKWVKDATVLAL